MTSPLRHRVLSSYKSRIRFQMLKSRSKTSIYTTRLWRAYVMAQTEGACAYNESRSCTRSQSSLLIPPHFH